MLIPVIRFVAHSTTITATLLVVIILATITTTAQSVDDTPTIVADGTPISSADFKIANSLGFLRNTYLNTAETEVLLADDVNGATICKTSPFTFDRKAAGPGAFACSWGNADTRVYCRQRVDATTFLVFTASTLASFSTPSYDGSSSTLGTVGLFTVRGDYLLVASDYSDGNFYRVNINTLNSADTLVAQNTDDATSDLKFGACSSTHCFSFSTTRFCSKFKIGTSTSGDGPAYEEHVDMTAHLANTVMSFNIVALDETNNLLYFSDYSTGGPIVKMTLSPLAFSQKSSTHSSAPSFTYICESCLTANNRYLMVLLRGGTADKVSFIKTSDMSEVTGADTDVSITDPVAAFLLQTEGKGAVLAAGGSVQKLTTTGVIPTTTSTTTSSTTTSTTLLPPRTTTTTIDPSLISNKQQDDKKKDSSDQAAIIGSSVGGVALLGLGSLVLYYFYRKSQNKAEEEAKAKAADAGEIFDHHEQEPNAVNPLKQIVVEAPDNNLEDVEVMSSAGDDYTRSRSGSVE